MNDIRITTRQFGHTIAIGGCLIALLLVCTGCDSGGTTANSPAAKLPVEPASPTTTDLPAAEATEAKTVAGSPAESVSVETPPATDEPSESSETEAKPPTSPQEVDDGPPKVSPAATRPKADRAPRRPGEAEKITFDDIIIGVQADVVFRPWMLTERAQELDGQRVSIPGFMWGGVAKLNKLQDFILLRNNQCKFGPGGQADHLANVVLREGRTTSFTTEPLNIEGTLRVAPFIGTDGNTWAIYELEDAVVK